MKYLIKREDFQSMMLQGLGIGCNSNNYTHDTEWTTCEFYAYKAENEQTAQAIINFIRDVIDWKLAEQLVIVPLEG